MINASGPPSPFKSVVSLQPPGISCSPQEGVPIASGQKTTNLLDGSFEIMAFTCDYE